MAQGLNSRGFQLRAMPTAPALDPSMFVTNRGNFQPFGTAILKNVLEQRRQARLEEERKQQEDIKSQLALEELSLKRQDLEMKRQEQESSRKERMEAQQIQQDLMLDRASRERNASEQDKLFGTEGFSTKEVGGFKIVVDNKTNRIVDPRNMIEPSAGALTDVEGTKMKMDSRGYLYAPVYGDDGKETGVYIPAMNLHQSTRSSSADINYGGVGGADNGPGLGDPLDYVAEPGSEADDLLMEAQFETNQKKREELLQKAIALGARKLGEPSSASPKPSDTGRRVIQF